MTKWCCLAQLGPLSCIPTYRENSASNTVRFNTWSNIEFYMVAEHCQRGISKQDHNSMKAQHLPPSQPSTVSITTGKQHQIKYNNATAQSHPHEERKEAWSYSSKGLSTRRRGLDRNYCSVRNSQQDGRHAATTAGTEATEAIAQARTIQRHLKKGYQRRNRSNTLTNQARHPHEKRPRTTARHSDTSSPIISTREEKTGGGLILWQHGAPYKHSEEVHGSGQHRRSVSRYLRSNRIGSRRCTVAKRYPATMTRFRTAARRIHWKHGASSMTLF